MLVGNDFPELRANLVPALSCQELMFDCQELMFDCQQPIPVGGSRQDDENRQAMPFSGGHRPQEGIEIHSKTPHRVESTCSLQDFNAKFARLS